MSKLIILLFLCLVLFLLLKIKEPFQSEPTSSPDEPELLQILDRADILQDFEDNSLAEIFNITHYKIMEFENKVSKMLKFSNSALRLKNLNNLENYTLMFYVEFSNSSQQQVIVNGVDVNNNIIYQVYTYNNSLFVKYYNKTHRFTDTIMPDELYPIVLGVTKNSLTCYFNYDTKILTTETPRETNNDIIIGSVFKNRKALNPFEGFIGNINLYNDIYSANQLLSFDSEGKSRVVERVNELCKFKPNGRSIEECKNKCKKNYECDDEYCEQICMNCIDYNQCQWLEKPKLEDSYIRPPEPDVPNPPKIKCIAGNAFIELRFKKPNDNYNPIKSYLVQLKKSYAQDGFVKLISFDAKDCGRNSCRYKIRGLDNQEYYNISVKAINSIGMSSNSNTETLAPNGEVYSKQISDALIETDDEIKQQVLQDFNYDNSNCDASKFVNYDEHILDTADLHSIDDFIKEQYVRK